ncbi:uncharacterized protein TrAtP1_006799 [Trichoderma atroviride]|uniref:uncharacterized protein n=1 Tax=Hypocrea atroviridis TaxID=63577 RepID=UPI00332B9A1F|nr:hypothetical protein TrAtP1_006799 [Trichoderma atroviride]
MEPQPTLDRDCSAGEILKENMAAGDLVDGAAQKYLSADSYYKHTAWGSKTIHRNYCHRPHQESRLLLPPGLCLFPLCFLTLSNLFQPELRYHARRANNGKCEQD